jgi:cob(I)alamin adenosyltransferase
MRIYTTTGDDGTTGLLHGGRTSKGDLLAEAVGTLDEVVADLGACRALMEPGEARDLVLRLQRELFVAGADLATNPDQRRKLTPEVSLVTAQMVTSLEGLIDSLVDRSPLPQEFLVPGATAQSASLDVARTTVRRAERRAVQLRDHGASVNPEVLRYLNRLSDLLFVLARHVAGGSEEPSRAP